MDLHVQVIGYTGSHIDRLHDLVLTDFIHLLLTIAVIHQCFDRHAQDILGFLDLDLSLRIDAGDQFIIAADHIDHGRNDALRAGSALFACW